MRFAPILVGLTVSLSSLTSSAMGNGIQPDYEIYTANGGPGLAILVSKDGSIIRKEAHGYEELEKKNKISFHTAFNLASNSKQFTAMAILILESTLSLSEHDSITSYIPELPKFMEAITVKDLIHHTSGLPDYMITCNSETPVENKNVIEFLKTTSKLNFSPGESFEYSNTGYVLLSEIVQRVSRKSFPEFIRDEIFKPLGLSESWVMSLQTEAQIKNRALGHGHWPFFKVNDFSMCDYVFGDGGVYTTIENYQKWLSSLQNTPLLTKPFSEKLFAKTTLKDGSENDYAYGWMHLEFAGRKAIFHNGSWTGSRSMAMYFPTENVWIAVLSNYAGIDNWDRLEEIAADVFAK